MRVCQFICSAVGMVFMSVRLPGTLWKRGYKEFLNFWFVFGLLLILTCCVGYIMGMREQFPGSWLNFVLNAFLIKSSYVGSFWFVQTYTILVLLSGVFFKLIKKVFLLDRISDITYTLCWCIWYWIYCFGTNSNRSGGAFGKCADALYAFAVFFCHWNDYGKRRNCGSLEALI